MTQNPHRPTQARGRDLEDQAPAMWARLLLLACCSFTVAAIVLIALQG